MSLLNATCAAGLMLLVCAAGAYRLVPGWKLDDIPRVADHHPQALAGSVIAISFPGEHITVKVRDFDDELEAWAAMVQLRKHPRSGTEPMITITPQGRPTLRLELPNDLLTAIPLLDSLRKAEVPGDADWTVIQKAAFNAWMDQSALFAQVYAGFGRYGAGRPEARIINDMSVIADFYELPLRLFLVPPDSDGSPSINAVWRQRPSPDDAILLHGPGSTLVIGRGTVAWHEIRDALLHAHVLFRGDKRDYQRLPLRLRPQPYLTDDVPPEALITYSGLMLRHLIDKAGGNRSEMLSAYTTRPDNPNVRHDPGVRRAAMYAKQVLAHALYVNRRKIAAEMRAR